MPWHIAYVIPNQSSTLSTSSNPTIDSEEIVNEQSLIVQFFQHEVFCHVFDQCVQNAKVGISILRDICFRQTTPYIKYAHLRAAVQVVIRAPRYY